MKNLLLGLALLGPAAGRAQTPAPAPALVVAPYRYCALVVDERYFGAPERLQLDYGQAAPGAVADPEMAEMAVNIRTSRSVIDVLNYLSRHGWEVLAVTTFPSRSSTSDSHITHVTDAETRYLLRRR